MTNFLESYTDKTVSAWRRLPRWKRISISAAGVLLLVILLLGGWGVVNVQAARQIADEGLAGKQSLEFAQVAIGNQDFARAQSDIAEAKEHFETADKLFNRFQVYRIIPGVATQLTAMDNVLQAGISLTSGIETVTAIGAEVNDVLGATGEDVSFADISAEDKGVILKTLSESSVELQSVKSDIELASLAIEAIPDTGLLEPVQQVTTPLKEQLPTLQSLVTQAIPLAQTLPAIMGYPSEKTYLFLLQNNRELRPTGGFIGTYGILKLENGEIQTFVTDNIYNLDNQAADIITEPSPAPIAAHTSTQNWLMRNSNWFPHFPASAAKAEQKYHEQGGPEDDIDGVIAVTPTFISSLLALTGPITVEGQQFTNENLTDTLQYESQIGFANDGLDESERKDIIGDLASQLMDELFALDQSQLPDIWEVFTENVNEKQILINVDDPLTQALIVEQNWAGEMKPYTGDYLMFVDANLAALKTDEVMDRTVRYSVSEENGDYYGTAEMEYQHNGDFGFFVTRYRTHTRIYLPQGSELVESSGFATGDKIQNGQPTDPEVYEETFIQASGEETTYTVIGGFTSIEPRTTGTLRIKYKLPPSIQQQIRQGNYALTVQKQPGTIAHGLEVDFDIGRPISGMEPLDTSEKIGENKAAFRTDLSVDRQFRVTR